PLEAEFYLPDPAEIDKEPAVDAEESLAFELLFKPVKAASGSPQHPLIGFQPDIVAVSLSEADLARVEHDPPVVPHGDHSVWERAGMRGAEEGVVRTLPEGGIPARRTKGK